MSAALHPESIDMHGSSDGVAKADGHLSYLPFGLFGATMGLTGLSAAWGFAHSRYGVSLWIARVIGLSRWAPLPSCL
jgi:hypothetical protein